MKKTYCYSPEEEKKSEESQAQNSNSNTEHFSNVIPADEDLDWCSIDNQSANARQDRVNEESRNNELSEDAGAEEQAESEMHEIIRTQSCVDDLSRQDN